MKKGTNISHYKILEKLGEGGMGVVYQAKDMKLKRDVALKFLSDIKLGDSEAKRRFKQEAQVVALLNHPNICTIFDIDEEDGQLFMAMEYVEGPTLQDKIKKSIPETEEVIHIAIQIARGLSEAHDKGIVHRDIKSANIIITPHGKVKIMDFGLAQVSTVTTKLTKEGTTLGTISYMSPEQTRGIQTDHRSDIWSFGVVLYEMLTGTMPFRGDYEQAVIYSILNEQPSGISAQAQYIPEGFHEIIGKCLAKDPGDRYQHADEILAKLRIIQRNLNKKHSKKKKRKISSIAVLPFENMNRDEESEFFSDGITEDIMTALSKIEALRVAARNSAFQYKGKTPDLRVVGRELNVNSVLVGSLRRAGNKLRITVRLNNIEDGYEIWSERYDRVMEDIFEIQDEISEAVVEALKVELIGDEKKKLKKRYTDDVKAYNYYLKGRYYWNTRGPDNIKKAITFFEKALKEDDEYALAHSGKADCYCALGILGGVAPKEVLGEGKKAAMKAIELDPNLAEAHTSLAFIEVVYNWNWDLADRKLKLAQKLDPNYATSWFWRAVFVLSGTGQYNEAVKEARIARQKQPTTAFIDAGVAFVEFFGGQYDRAIREAKKTLELDPEYHYAHWTLGRAYLQKGDYQKALEEFSKVKGITFKKGNIGYVYALSGNKKKALEILDELTHSKKPDYIKAFQIAMIYAGLEDKDRAFEWLDCAYKAKNPLMVWVNQAPEFKQLFDDHRWNQLLKQMKLIKDL